MAMTAALLPIPATLSPASADPENEESVSPVVVDRITPDAIDEDSTLRVAGEVTNTTDASVEDVTVRIRYSRHSFSSREELDEFASGEGWQPDAEGPEEEFEGALEPDAGLEYTLSTPVEDLGLGSYGVYPMVVEAVDGDGDRLGAQYTFLPYTGDDDVDALDLAWVWPLMDDPQRADDDTFLSEDLHTAVTEDGRLGRLLATGAQVPLSFEPGEEDLIEELGLEEDEGEGEPSPEASPSPTEESPEAEATEGGSPSPEASPSPEDEATEDEPTEAPEEDDEAPEEIPERTDGVPITWAVDPGTMDDILRGATEEHDVLEDLLEVPAGSEPERHRLPADVASQVWLREARRVLPADTVVATPYANTDLVSLLRNDMGADAEASLSLAQEAMLRALAMEADGRFAFPARGLMDENVQELYSEHDAHRFLLRESALPPLSRLSTTPTTETPLPAGENDEEEPFALVSDSGLTQVLSMPSHGPGEATLALQRFAAETAMIAGENVGVDRVVVASPVAGWDPSPELASGVLEATEDLPWLSPERLDRVEPAEPGEREETREDLTYPDHAYDDELSSTYLGQVEDVGRDVRLFNSILVGDSDPFRPAIVRLESVYWREREALAGATRSVIGQSVQNRMQDVRVIPGEPVTLASSTGITGVLVANDLEDETVYVHLSVYSENSERLNIGGYTSDFEIEPGAKTTVYIPLSARINGTTTVHVSLQNSNGEPISPQETLIQVNATGLGTQALLISGIGLLILIAALAPRALRKWARRQAAKAAAAEGVAPNGEANDAEDTAGTGVTGGENGADDEDAADRAETTPSDEPDVSSRDGSAKDDTTPTPDGAGRGGEGAGSTGEPTNPQDTEDDADTENGDPDEGRSNDGDPRT
ncbi:DUF6049 family protein [Nocardiopsis sp. MG754419]|uniref:DUF6049 family protein n=1 Tax=Nocardiopsis sp. MG754419 TaxID=2259865 RepID=UPI002011D200